MQQCELGFGQMVADARALTHAISLQGVTTSTTPRSFVLVFQATRTETLFQSEILLRGSIVWSCTSAQRAYQITTAQRTQQKRKDVPSFQLLQQDQTRLKTASVPSGLFLRRKPSSHVLPVPRDTIALAHRLEDSFVLPVATTAQWGVASLLPACLGRFAPRIYPNKTTPIPCWLLMIGRMMCWLYHEPCAAVCLGRWLWDQADLHH
mmetsp:Transcript_30700/g.48127  ORF Transcript_30700/g.48127 Transcript_30700/m.48127 type:complete len:207 (+) Transcript_30700:2375-2995(+)